MNLPRIIIIGYDIKNICVLNLEFHQRLLVLKRGLSLERHVWHNLCILKRLLVVDTIWGRDIELILILDKELKVAVYTLVS